MLPNSNSRWRVSDPLPPSAALPLTGENKAKVRDAQNSSYFACVLFIVPSIKSWVTNPKIQHTGDWIKKHEDSLVYSEPAGQWLVKADLYWELETRNRGNPIAEEIAWDGATTGIPGECEGYIPCYFAVFLLSDARYLDVYPNGRHAEEAAEHIDYLLQEILKPNNPYTMDSRDFGELRESIAKLSTILDRSSILKKTTLLTRLKRIEETYH
jgi:hypothetical protein